MSTPTTSDGLPGIAWWNIFSLAAFAENQDIYSSGLCGFQYHYSYLPNKFIYTLKAQFSQFPYD